MIEAMPPRITLVFLFLALGLPGIAQEKNDMHLDFNMMPVPAWAFFTIEPSSRDGEYKPKPGVRQMKGYRSGVFDVRGFLSKYGVSFPAGSVALYDKGGLVVFDTAPNLALINSIFGKTPPVTSPETVSIEISTYECTLPPSKKLLPWEELMFADLAELPKGSVKLVDRNAIAIEHGKRGVSNNILNPISSTKAEGDNGVNPAQFHAGETGSLLLLESVVEPDNQTVDINIDYRLRTKAAHAGNNGYAESKFTTSFTAWNDYPLVVNSVPVEGQPGKYFVVVARAQLMDLNVFKLPPPEPGVKPGDVAATPNAPGGLPPDTLKIVDAMMDSLDDAAPCNVSAELSAYVCNFPDIADPHQLDKLTFVELEKKPRNSVKIIDCASFITKNGQRAVTSDLAGPDLTKKTTDQPRPAGRVFQAGETGTILEVEPVVGSDGKKIDTNATFNLRLETGAPGGKEIVDINKTVTFKSAIGDPHIVMVSPVENHKGKYLVVVMRMGLLSLDGRNITHAGIQPQGPTAVAPAKLE